MKNKEVFSNVYRKELWGKELNSNFFSGVGSRGILANKFIEYVSLFINNHSDIKNIVDIGCGDFYVSEKILKNIEYENYCGIDVVDELIIFNNKKYANEKIKFLCFDITTNDIPKGDLCIIRQVLQHLCNYDIHKIISNLKNKFKYILVTEHVYILPKFYNFDQPRSEHVYRLWNQSGVYLNKSPFNLQTKEVLSIDITNKEAIKTFLIENL